MEESNQFLEENAITYDTEADEKNTGRCGLCI